MSALESEASRVAPSDPSCGSDEIKSGQHIVESARAGTLQCALASHLKELQKYIDDWSEHQKHLLDSVLLASANHQRDMQGITWSSKPVHQRQVATVVADSDDLSHIRSSDGYLEVQVTDSSGVSSHKRGSELANEPEKPGKLSGRRSTLQQEDVNAISTLLTSPVSKTIILEKNTSFTDKMRTLNLSDRSNRLLEYIEDCIVWANEKSSAGEKFVQSPNLQSCLARCVLSNFFERLCAIIIIANSVFIGYTSDYAMQHLEAPSTDLLDAVELAFTVFYLMELLLRIYVLGWFFIFSPDWRWSLFDTFLVASAVSDQIQERVGGGSGSGAYVLRILRIQKMVKVLRMVRMLRNFRELRMILNLLIGSLKAMTWSILLVCLIAYVLGVIFLQAATAALMESSSGRSNPEELQSTTDSIKKYWGSLADSMLYLFAASTGAMRFAERDEETMIQEELRKKHEYIDKIRAMFARVASSEQSQLDKEDFQMILGDSEMMAFMANLEIDAFDAEHFFNMLTDDGKRSVDIETFVVGCMKMRGYARSTDLHGLIHSSGIYLNKIKKIERELQSLKEGATQVPVSEKMPIESELHSLKQGVLHLPVAERTSTKPSRLSV